MRKSVIGSVLGGFVVSVLSGCASPPQTPPPIQSAAHVDDHITHAKLIKEPPSRTGNPDSYTVFGKNYFVDKTSEGYREQGLASWYGPKFHGKRTSSGTPYDMYAMTAAHKSLPIPTYARVTHRDNGRSIVVKINDRGPFVGDRIIDLSYAAATKLDMIDSGTASVEVVALPPYQYLADYEPPQQNTQRLASAETRQETILPTVGDSTVAERAERDMPIEETSRSEQIGGEVNTDNETIPSIAANGAQASPDDLPAAELLAVAYPASPSTPTGATPPSSTFAASGVQTANKADFFLQVGAFTQAFNAEQLHRRLANLVKHPVHIAEPSDALYRVKIGPLANLEETRQLQGRLANLGIDAHPVVFD
jgi:rare lipoprotein A